MKLFFAVLFTGILFGCANKAIKGNGDGQTIKKAPMNLKATLGKSKETSDPLTIQKATVKGNNLILEVSYSGGCKDHAFELSGNEMISKSLPPIRSVRLIHKSNGDGCEALLTQTLHFDISELAYKKEAGSEIMLNIEGVDGNVRYTFE